ncbi:hypothetical protein [Salinimonas marina]|uniref:hypothetical protein n=1 Tax=Salinimonas marina TaxID=2785918 RepID=UPI001E2E3464|nr:hypothetical protein [Salinimonas marina]
MTNEANNTLRSFIEQHGRSIKWLSITSKGGEVNEGMDLGSIVFDHPLNVAVDKYCLFSCANYVFSAAPAQRISKHALIGFHGGVSGLEQHATEAKLQSYMQAALSREEQFFEKIGVEQRITTLGQLTRYDAIPNQSELLGWYSSIEDMTRLEVRNIEVTNPPWSYKPLSENVSFFRVKVGDMQ